MDKPEALRLAEFYEGLAETPPKSPNNSNIRAAAAELRRLHAECNDLAHQLNESNERNGRLKAQRDALLEALKPMIDLAEFWINHRQERRMSEQEYKVWIALGHESNAMLKARAAIKAVEETK